MTSRPVFQSVILIIGCGLLLMSCGVPLTKGKAWLDLKKAPHEIDVSGRWNSPEWGKSTFKQDGRDVTGWLGDYPVKGVVSGDSLYLLIYSGERVRYFSELKPLDGSNLRGFYSRSGNIDEGISASAYQVTLTRTSVAGVKYDGRVFITEDRLPPSIEFEEIDTVYNGTSFYGRLSDALPVIADDARKLRANVIVEVKTWYKPNPIAWACPHATGRAVWVHNIKMIESLGLKGEWY